MERATPIGGSLTGDGSRANLTTNPAGAAVEQVVQAAHRTTDRIVDKTTAQVERLGGAAHHAVNRTADVASAAAAWARPFRSKRSK
jgi:hypothetical protein